MTKQPDSWLDADSRYQRMRKFAHLLGPKLAAKHGAKEVQLLASRLPRGMHLGTLLVDKNKRKQGVGSAVMQDLAKKADRHKITMTLELADANNVWGTTSSGRLRKFYVRHGWQSNRGKAKDFRLSAYANMYRKPKS